MVDWAVSLCHFWDDTFPDVTRIVIWVWNICFLFKYIDIISEKISSKIILMQSVAMGQLLMTLVMAT